MCRDKNMIIESLKISFVPLVYSVCSENVALRFISLLLFSFSFSLKNSEGNTELG